ncbi:MAG: hypothetical protein J6I73_08925 [Treponema sp.]|nr:hypothetical protein [Treponema sp.]
MGKDAAFHKTNLFKATLRQEWKASKNRIAYTSAVIAIVLLGAALTNFIAYQTQSNHVTFFGMTMYVIGMLGLWAIPIYALARGSGNIRFMLFGDTSYLMLLVPERSYALLAAKQLINLAEFAIYAIPAAIYLSFMGPTAGLIFKELFTILIPFETDLGVSYWENVRSIYHWVFVEHFFDMLQYCARLVILFVSAQATFNCAFALYSAFIHTKKPNGFLILVILFFLFYLPLRITFIGIEGNAMSSFWNHLLRYVIFAAVYFAATSWLLENKLEV